MKRWFSIWVCMALSLFALAQDDIHIVDSLENVVVKQEGSEKIQTMIQLVWAFYDVSFDDGIAWGEKAMRLAHQSGMTELEADAAFAIGIQFGYHNDLDLAQEYLKQSYALYQQADNDERAFEALWNQAYFELVLGNMDSAYVAFQKARNLAEQRHDSLACAQVNDNLAVISYQRNDYEGSITAFKASRAFYASLNDSVALAKTDLNLATMYGESGRWTEARDLFISVIPRLEAFHDYDFLLLAYKNYGLLFERDIINYDSANYYLEKALAVTEVEGVSRADLQTMHNAKADVLAELGNVAFAQDKLQQAINDYEASLALAQSNGYQFGQMQALLGLGRLYAKQGFASKSLRYLEHYAEIASQSGITMMEPVVKKALILDYARLGRYDALELELEYLDEHRAALTREYADISELHRNLSEDYNSLLTQYESQNNQIETLQSQRNHYRMAFYGLLAIALFVVVLSIAYKIVRKNRIKV